MDALLGQLQCSGFVSVLLGVQRCCSCPPEGVLPQGTVAKRVAFPNQVALPSLWNPFGPSVMGTAAGKECKLDVLPSLRMAEGCSHSPDSSQGAEAGH